MMIAAICRPPERREDSGIRTTSLVIVSVAALLFAGCGVDGSVLPEEGSRPGMGSIHPDADATDARFLAVGCVLAAVSDSGTVLVPMKGGSPWRRYDCPGVAREDLSTACRSHMEWLTGDESGAVPAMSGRSRPVLLFDHADRQTSRYELATDGRYLYFTLGKPEADIWQVELEGR